MYTLTIQCQTLDDLRRVARNLGDQFSDLSKVDVAVSPDAEKPILKNKAPKKEESKVPLVSTTSTSTAVPGQISEISYDQVKALVLEVAKTLGREASIDLLLPFGVVTGEGKERTGKMGKLTPDQYENVIKSAKQMLENKDV